MNNVFHYSLHRERSVVMTKVFKFLFSRAFITAMLILLQVAIFILGATWLKDYSQYIHAFFYFLSLLVMIAIIINKSESLQMKLPWLVLIALFPVLGIFCYYLFSENNMRKKFVKNLSKQSYSTKDILPETKQIPDNIKVQQQSLYIAKACDMPAYQNTKAKYFEIGELYYTSLLEKLKKAEKFIFIESFIVSEGVMLDSILEILKQKVKDGVEVRMMFDDWGTITTLPYRYNKKLESYGIQCVIFNPLLPILTIRHNNRDHKKIIIIDGNIAYTGGVNLADEYINEKLKYGHWKDSGILIEGEAVKNFTLMFLESWHYYRDREEDYQKYMPTKQETSDGYIQPYIYNPTNDELVARNIYVNILNDATQYVYITTPYLIMDVELTNAILSAAKRGIDVRIITPHIPDKWYVHAVTKSFYLPLLKAGVKIYEYTPGFIHAKNVICDDMIATVGTVNFDYRSLYHNYECGVWMYQTSIIANMKNDFIRTQEISMEMSQEMMEKVPFVKKVIAEILKFFSPLL